jgi:GNAT superfamily N-acetyltransferase
MKKINFVQFSLLSEEQLSVIALSIISLDSGFYNRISSNKREVVDTTVKLLQLCTTDCGAGEALLVDDDLVGFISYYPYSERRLRGLSALKIITDDLKKGDDNNVMKFILHAKKFQKLLQPVEQINCFYLNKISTLANGSGYGAMLFERYLQKAKEAKLEPVFHVRNDNEKALRFYQKMGFNIESSFYTYSIVTRKA